jgi:RND family efflux transporter MFP subunit
MTKATLDQLRIEREPENEPSGRAWVWVVVSIVLLAGAGIGFWFRPDPAIEVQTAPVQVLRGNAASTVLNASGYVTARRQATVSSKVTGKVMEIFIEEGMEVEENQVLAQLDDSNVKARFALAEAQLNSARTAVKETAALLREAELNLERTRQLVDQQLASAAELDRNRALKESLAARLDLRNADVAVAARSLEIYQQQLDDTIIRAPFSGVVVAKNAQPGEMISPISAGGGFTRTGIGTLVDMSSLEVEIDVNEAYINRVKPGQAVVATLDSYPDWRIPCHVIAIIPTADRQRATVEVRVGFDELDSRILPDMGVKVAFQEEPTAGRKPGGVLVPDSAVRTRDGREVVLVVNDGIVESRAITASGSRGADILVIAGLKAGETVVTKGPPDLAQGDRVKESKE